MIHTNLIEQILDLADAPLLHQQIGIKLNEERVRREKFYNRATNRSIDESMKVEFINGEVVVHSPVMKRHNEANGLLYKILDTHVRRKDLGFVGFEKIMVVFTRNDYEPDLVFFDKEKSDEMKPTQTLFPVPDFVVEVLSNGTKKYDRGIKYDDYETHKVKEYWIIDPDNEVVEQYILKEEAYELVYKSSQGMIKSVVVKDFEIPIRAIFDADINFEVLQKMMQS
jgi:Uma2 family endonuclease